MTSIDGLIERRSGWVVAALLLFGAALRASWLSTLGLSSLGGEALHIAESFARTGSIADTFGRGSGLSAHLSPIPTLFAGYVYRIFGVQSAEAELVLSIFSIGTALASGYVLVKIFERLGMPALWRIIALFLYVSIPLYFIYEIAVFRIWEGGITVLLSLLLLWWLLRCDGQPGIAWKDWAGLSLLASIIFFLTPPMGVAAFAMVGILMLRRAPWRRWAALMGVSGAILVAVLTPWTVRNYLAFDSFIPLRSNAGLELALANHPLAADATADQRQVLADRYNAIHPFATRAAYDHMLTFGNERAYAQSLGREARSWIAAHPMDFARLCARHIYQFYFLPSWLWDVHQRGANNIEHLYLFCRIAAALALVGALAGLLLWRGPYLYVAAAMLVPSLPYAMAQPTPRYHYLIYGLSIFMAVDLIRRLAGGEWRGKVATRNGS